MNETPNTTQADTDRIIEMVIDGGGFGFELAGADTNEIRLTAEYELEQLVEDGEIEASQVEALTQAIIRKLS